jgi:hypothetical protein
VEFLFTLRAFSPIRGDGARQKWPVGASVAVSNSLRIWDEMARFLVGRHNTGSSSSHFVPGVAMTAELQRVHGGEALPPSYMPGSDAAVDPAAEGPASLSPQRDRSVAVLSILLRVAVVASGVGGVLYLLVH